MARTSSIVRIGVDVGGTNTDAVVLDPSQHAQPSRGVLASRKVPTTRDPTTGIEEALRAVLTESNVPRETIASVTIGTTAFLNSVIERDSRRLSKVGIIRLSKSFLRDVPPFADWPAGLANILRGYVGYVDGGLTIDGSEEAPLVEQQVVDVCKEIRELGLKAVVVAGVYSPIDREFHQEQRVRDIVAREIPGADIVCSHEVANIGFLERENASILNAAILRFARRTIHAFQSALKSLDLTCPLYLTQNDGTLLDGPSASRIPIRTFSSGVTNSMRGAAYLSGYGDKEHKAAIVVDVGGTTTDIGVLLPSGLPRKASAYVEVAGVQVNYELPHLHSIGLGGGSIVQVGDKVSVGPASVGHELHKSIVFGGDTTTATDIAVAAGRAKVGSVDAVRGLDAKIVEAAQARIKTLLQNGIDAIKTSPEPMPVLLTGGGSVLAPDSLPGASELIMPPFHDVANAVGAACAKVGATIDIIQSTNEQTLAEATEAAKEMAIEKAVEAGAKKETVAVASVDVMPIPYLEGQIRSMVTAIGELDLTAQKSQAAVVSDVEVVSADEPVADKVARPIEDDTRFDHENYRPSVAVNPDTKIPEWRLSAVDLDYIADGCYLLGCGGGGNPHAGKLQLRHMLEAGHILRVVDLASAADDARVYWGGRMGAPAAISERLQAHETVLAIKALMSYLGHEDFDAVMGLEIGGSNGMEPFLWGSSRFFDRPVLDGDFMGRANPMCWQTTLTVHQPGQFAPCAIDSGDGRTMVMTRAGPDERVDKPLRGAISEMGSLVGLAPQPTTGEAARKYGVARTISLAWRIGRAIARASARNSISTVADAIVDEVGGSQSAKVLFRGKISSIERTVKKGLSVGVLHIVPTAAEDEEGAVGIKAVAEGGTLRIPFVNENILAEHVPAEGAEPRVLATVPDLIALIDSQSGKPVGVPEYRYGCHVTLLGIPCSPRWSETERGIEVGGPKGYGYDLEYRPLGKYAEPRSVISEFAP